MINIIVLVVDILLHGSILDRGRCGGGSALFFFLVAGYTWPSPSLPLDGRWRVVKIQSATIKIQIVVVEICPKKDDADEGNLNKGVEETRRRHPRAPSGTRTPLAPWDSYPLSPDSSISPSSYSLTGCRSNDKYGAQGASMAGLSGLVGLSAFYSLNSFSETGKPTAC